MPSSWHCNSTRHVFSLGAPDDSLYLVYTSVIKMLRQFILFWYICFIGTRTWTISMLVHTAGNIMMLRNKSR
jgi:hypothetical protein